MIPLLWGISLEYIFYYFVRIFSIFMIRLHSPVSILIICMFGISYCLRIPWWSITVYFLWLRKSLLSPCLQDMKFSLPYLLICLLGFTYDDFVCLYKFFISIFFFVFFLKNFIFSLNFSFTSLVVFNISFSYFCFYDLS